MLGGGLQLMLGGYIPSSADTITILSAAGSLTGSFTNIATGQRLDTIDGIGSFLVHYGIGSALDPNQIFLTAFEPTGDYNGDGSFDAADYVLWRKKDGSQGGYNIWRANFGRTTSDGSGANTNAAIPEPATQTLFVAVLIGAFLRSARQRHKPNVNDNHRNSTHSEIGNYSQKLIRFMAHPWPSVNSSPRKAEQDRGFGRPIRAIKPRISIRHCLA
jgi:hypothetical protein